MFVAAIRLRAEIIAEHGINQQLPDGHGQPLAPGAQAQRRSEVSARAVAADDDAPALRVQMETGGLRVVEGRGKGMFGRQPVVGAP